MSHPGAFEQPASEPAGPPHSSAVVEATAAPPALLTDAVSEPERLGAIDLARGIALAGIFFVNMMYFAQPFGMMLRMPEPPPGSGVVDAVAYYFVMIFCAGKFYPLFSMLFGIGFMIQLERAARAGRRFVPAYLRRLAFLCVLGLAHGLLLWYGDILFTYSIAGLILFAVIMLFPRISAPALLATGIVLVMASAVTGISANLLLAGPPDAKEHASLASREAAEPATLPATAPSTATAPATTPSTRPQIPTEGSPGQRLLAGIGNGALTTPPNPADPRYVELEVLAYREGSYWDMFVMRGIAWLFMILFTVIAGFGLHVLGMFFIGAALFRGGLLYPQASAWHKRFLLLGAVVGLPLVVLSIAVPEFASDRLGRMTLMLAAMLNMFGGPLMSLAYLGGAALLVSSGALRPVVNAISRVGRMALTNYLSETLIATYLMYSWGLGWFGSVKPAGQVLIVLCVYLGLIITSTIWLRYFQFGPMEWIWRLVTYFRPQPLLRRKN